MQEYNKDPSRDILQTMLNPYHGFDDDRHKAGGVMGGKVGATEAPFKV